MADLRTARRELFGFVLAGVLGLLVDTGVLYAVRETLGLVLGRALSFLAAVLTTWVVNRTLTFRHRHSGLGLAREFWRYLGLMLAGGAVNYLVYLLLVWNWTQAEHHPVLGVAAGSLAGMAVNWLSARFLVFAHRRDG